MRRMRRWRATKWLLGIIVAIATLFGRLLGISTLLLAYTSVGISIGIILTLLFLLAIIGGYHYNWRWTGVGQYSTPPKGNREWHHRKTLWDWLQLFIIPAVLAGGALLFNAQNERTQQELATNTQREAALQAYINSMSDHLLHDDLRTSRADAEIRSVADTRTLSTLRQLDGARRGQVVQFLAEAGLITNTSPSPGPIISLDGADLRGADLTDANMEDAYLRSSHLTGADLTGAYLHRPTVTKEQLATCQSLRGATLPDGTKVPEDIENPFH